MHVNLQALLEAQERVILEEFLSMLMRVLESADQHMLSNVQQQQQQQHEEGRQQQSQQEEEGKEVTQDLGQQHEGTQQRQQQEKNGQEGKSQQRHPHDNMSGGT